MGQARPGNSKLAWSDEHKAEVRDVVAKWLGIAGRIDSEGRLGGVWVMAEKVSVEYKAGDLRDENIAP